MLAPTSSSGRSDFVSSAFSKVDSADGGRRGDALDRGRAALGRRRERGVRTVMTFLASGDCTVWMALPA